MAETWNDHEIREVRGDLNPVAQLHPIRSQDHQSANHEKSVHVCPGKRYTYPASLIFRQPPTFAEFEIQRFKDAEADVAKLSCERVWECGYTRYEDKQDKPSDFGDTRRPFNLTLRPWLGSLKHIDLINSWNGPEEKNGWNYSEF